MPFPSNKSVLPVLPKVKNGMFEASDSNLTCTIEDKELRKKLRNRQSALAARERKKARMLELERQVASLQQSKKRLEEENQSLRHQVNLFSRRCQRADAACIGNRDFLPASHHEAFVQLKRNEKSDDSATRYPINKSSIFSELVSATPNSQKQFNSHSLSNLQNSCDYQKHFDRSTSSSSSLNFADKNDFGFHTGHVKNNMKIPSQYSQVPFFGNETNSSVTYMSAVKQEREFLNCLNQIGLSDPNQFSSPGTDLSKNPNETFDLNKPSDADPSDLLPSIGVILDPMPKKARIESKCFSFSNLHSANQYPLQNNNQFISHSESIKNTFRKSRSYHSFDGLSNATNCSLSNAPVGMTHMNRNTTLSSQNTGNHQAFATIASPNSDSAFRNDFSDFVFADPDLDGFSMLQDIPNTKCKEEISDFPSSRSDSGISVDEHFEWVNDSQRFLL